MRTTEGIKDMTGRGLEPISSSCFKPRSRISMRSSHVLRTNHSHRGLQSPNYPKLLSSQRLPQAQPYRTWLGLAEALPGQYGHNKIVDGLSAGLRSGARAPHVDSRIRQRCREAGRAAGLFREGARVARPRKNCKTSMTHLGKAFHIMDAACTGEAEEPGTRRAAAPGHFGCQRHSAHRPCHLQKSCVLAPAFPSRTGRPPRPSQTPSFLQW